MRNADFKAAWKSVDYLSQIFVVVLLFLVI